MTYGSVRKRVHLLLLETQEHIIIIIFIQVDVTLCKWVVLPRLSLSILNTDEQVPELKRPLRLLMTTELPSSP